MQFVWLLVKGSMRVGRPQREIMLGELAQLSSMSVR